MIISAEVPLAGASMDVASRRYRATWHRGFCCVSKRKTVKVGTVGSDDVATDLASALVRHEAAAKVWEQLSDEQHETYLYWIASAKTAVQRSERVSEVVKLLPSLPAMTQYGRGSGGGIHGFPATP
jgi:hypothetical protein